LGFDTAYELRGGIFRQSPKSTPNSGLYIGKFQRITQTFTRELKP
jgi:hypothetical protein